MIKQSDTLLQLWNQIYFKTYTFSRAPARHLILFDIFDLRKKPGANTLLTVGSSVEYELLHLMNSLWNRCAYDEMV